MMLADEGGGVVAGEPPEEVLLGVDEAFSPGIEGLEGAACGGGGETELDAGDGDDAGAEAAKLVGEALGETLGRGERGEGELVKGEAGG